MRRSSGQAKPLPSPLPLPPPKPTTPSGDKITSSNKTLNALVDVDDNNGGEPAVKVTCESNKWRPDSPWERQSMAYTFSPASSSSDITSPYYTGSQAPRCNRARGRTGGVAAYAQRGSRQGRGKPSTRPREKLRGLFGRGGRVLASKDGATVGNTTARNRRK